MPRIVAIEDDEDNMRLVCDLLTAYNYEVIPMFSVVEIVDEIIAIQPDLILMDISLNGIDGFALTKLLKSHMFTKNIPIVAITANASWLSEEKARTVGCDGFIAKPINTRALPHVLQQFIERSENYEKNVSTKYKISHS